MNITNTLLFFVDFHILSTKNKSVFAYVVCIYLTSRGLNDNVKLTKFGTSGP